MNKLETALARNAHKKRAYAFLATLQKAVPFKNPILLAGFEDADKLHDMISFDGSIDDADPVFSLDVACAQFQDTPFAKLPEDQCYLRFYGDEGYVIRLSKKDLLERIGKLMAFDGETLVAMSETGHGCIFDRTEEDGVMQYRVLSIGSPIGAA